MIVALSACWADLVAAVAESKGLRGSLALGAVMSRGARALYRLLEARAAGQYACRSRLIGPRGWR